MREFDLAVYLRQLTEYRLVDSGIEIRADSLHSGQCTGCEQVKPDIARRRLNTMYAEEESNWLESCKECYDETVAYYKELWAEYYASI